MPSDPNIGRVILDQYRILEPIGEGGFGQVYRADQFSMGRQAAIKLLKPELGSDPKMLARFRREAQAVSAINHPNVVVIYNFGQLDGGVHYLAMELVEGESLRATLRRAGTLPVAQALDISIQTAEALGAAHLRQVLHRDLKPENILLTRMGEREHFVKVLDFGIALLMGGQGSDEDTPTRLTSKGIIGTPYYVSPEQALGFPLDHRSDIYSLGVLLYELLTGCFPYHVEGQLHSDQRSPMALLMAHATQEAVPLLELPAPPPISPELDRLILDVLSKDREQRPESMGEFATRMRVCLAQVESDPALRAAADRQAGLGLAFAPTLAGQASPLPTGSELGLAHTVDGQASPLLTGSELGLAHTVDGQASPLLTGSELGLAHTVDRQASPLSAGPELGLAHTVDGQASPLSMGLELGLAHTMDGQASPTATGAPDSAVLPTPAASPLPAATPEARVLPVRRRRWPAFAGLFVGALLLGGLAFVLLPRLRAPQGAGRVGRLDGGAAAAPWWTRPPRQTDALREFEARSPGPPQDPTPTHSMRASVALAVFRELARELGPGRPDREGEGPDPADDLFEQMLAAAGGASRGVQHEHSPEPGDSEPGHVLRVGLDAAGWRALMERYAAQESIQRFGLTVADPLPHWAQRGALVLSATRGGLASKAGLQSGDVVQRAGKDEIDDPEDLSATLGRLRKGRLTLSVLRPGAAPLSLTVRAPRRARSAGAATRRPAAGKEEDDGFNR